MKRIGLPQKQGLYDPQFEHDACGIGFVANIKGKKSNQIVHQALQVLCNLDHRGGQGSEKNTGDGAGILIQIPHKFFAKVCGSENIHLPGEGKYGVGMAFLPPDAQQRDDCEKLVNDIIIEEGQQLLGWRTVPTDHASLGDTA
ncbi:MAG: hypothetical protein JWN30_1091, partial [Bacilli bacterium]|nr:hypothetical protein [Bacilli bacterium]